MSGKNEYSAYWNWHREKDEAILLVDINSTRHKWLPIESDTFHLGGGRGGGGL